VTPEVLDALGLARDRTLGIVAHLDDGDLERVIDPIMSPLAWDLGHIAAYEDLWINHRLGGHDLVRSDLAMLYDAFETPRKVRGGMRFLRGEHLLAYMDQVRERARKVPVGDGILHELVARHELQHAETMLQTMALGGLLPDGDEWRPQPAGGDGLDFVEVPGGPAPIGAPAEGFAYDNERPRHMVEVPSFKVGRTPVTNATWLHFCEGGGYVRREWWSREGWAWKEDFDITHHACAGAGDPDAPVVHVSWFEADAFARAHGVRLPTEDEWEKAATWGQLEGTGEVWEWTASCFAAYDGFAAHPYREYSEPFFGDRYRVLRGGSCCTSPRVGTPHFRNWDLPARRQLFAGVRLAA
jgi:gamma-glutamyl hercynylcysteine S-oxide synthase